MRLSLPPALVAVAAGRIVRIAAEQGQRVEAGTVPYDPLARSTTPVGAVSRRLDELLGSHGARGPI